MKYIKSFEELYEGSNKNEMDYTTIVSNLFSPQDTFSTKELGELLGVSTPEAYRICVKLEKEGLISKNGYKTKYGWEDATGSKLRPNSLYWQMS